VGQSDATARNKVQPLNAKQLRCIDLLALGHSDREAAEEVDVERTTVWRWRTSYPAYLAELNRRREELWRSSTDRLRALLPRALDVIESAVDSGDRATALNIVKLAGLQDVDFGRTGPTNAEVIAEAEERERRRRENEQNEEEVRAAERARDLELRRLLAY